VLTRADRPLRLAFLGTRGIPAGYSGFETCAEQLGVRLVERGHQVTVYCREHFQTEPRDSYLGVRLVTFPVVRHKYLETLHHTIVSGVHALTEGYDAVLTFIAGNSVVAWIPRLAGVPVALHVDGLDWRRRKWPEPAKRYLRFAERLSRHTANVVVTDSHAVVDFYRRTYGFEPTYIPYGSEVRRRPPGETLARFGLEPGRYILFVGRLVPENCAHHLVEAFRGLDTGMKCVIVGDAPYVEAYQTALRATDDPRVVFTGYVFGDGYAELSSSAYAFVETSEVGGTHPALLEAMGSGSAVIVNDTAENLETIAGAGLAYDGRSGGAALREVLKGLLDDPARRDVLAAAAKARVDATYAWEAVTDRYEELFREMVRRRRGGAAPPGPSSAGS